MYGVTPRGQSITQLPPPEPGGGQGRQRDNQAPESAPGVSLDAHGLGSRIVVDVALEHVGSLFDWLREGWRPHGSGPLAA